MEKGYKFEVFPKLKMLKRGLPKDPDLWIYVARNLQRRIELCLLLARDGYMPYKEQIENLTDAQDGLLVRIKAWERKYE